MATFINVYIGQSLKNSLTRSKHIHIPESKATVVSPKGIPGRIRTSNLVLEYLRLNDRPTGQRQSVQDFLAYRSPHFSVDNFMVILNAMRGTTSIDTPLSRDDAH